MSKNRFKTIHGIQIVFGWQFAFVSLKNMSPQKYIAKMTRQWRMILTTFLHQSKNLQILKLNLWLKSTTSFFMKTLLLLNVFLPVGNLPLIKTMPSNKAPGIDKVPTRVLKDSLLITLPFITSIINASLIASTFPEVWKTAEITPIPKQGNHELPNNNRPISLLPALSKVCERVVYNQFVTYLTTKERLTTKLCGNKKWFSTDTSLIHTTDAFLKGIDDKKFTACVLLDMSKAFDSVDNQILLRKIQSVGASTSTLKWSNSYLTNKYQVVRIHSSVSDPLPVECGVPQGSILGPSII